MCHGQAANKLFPPKGTASLNHGVSVSGTSREQTFDTSSGGLPVFKLLMHDVLETSAYIKNPVCRASGAKIGDMSVLPAA